jgi:hypothetical protein
MIKTASAQSFMSKAFKELLWFSSRSSTALYRRVHSASCFSSLANTSETVMCSSPRLARPVPRAELVFSGVTRMPRSKTFSSAGLVFFDRHIRVPKPNKFNFVAFFGQYCTFLSSAWGPFRLVVPRKGLSPVFNSSRRGSSDAFCGGHTNP